MTQHLQCANCGGKIAVPHGVLGVYRVTCRLCNVVFSEPTKESVAKAKRAPRTPPNLWSLIHQRHADAIKSGIWDEQVERKYHDIDWKYRIPMYGCNCQQHYADVERSISVDWSTAESAFRGMWERHNYVSEHHAGRPTISYEQSHRLWTGPKVAFLSSSYLSVGGTEIFHRMLIPRLRERVNIIGFAATAFTGGDGSLLKVPYYTGVEAARELAAQADVIVTWGIDTVEHLLPADRPQRIISVHHSDSSSKWSNRLQAIPCVDEVICVNAHTAEFLRGELSKPIRHIANCVDPIRVSPTIRRDELRLRYSIPQDAKVCLWGHRFSEEKQPRKAVEIARALPDGWIMALVGDGEMASDFQSDERVRVVGPVTSLADWFQASDVFISLSTYDGYGLSVAEALAYGIPTVSTPKGIAVGRTLTCPAMAPVSEWVSLVDAAYGDENRPQEDLMDIDRFISEWVDVCTGSSNYKRHAIQTQASPSPIAT
jgi:glycosyltransferase involved in cell wall biosynthesis